MTKQNNIFRKEKTMFGMELKRSIRPGLDTILKVVWLRPSGQPSTLFLKILCFLHLFMRPCFVENFCVFLPFHRKSHSVTKPEV